MWSFSFYPSFSLELFFSMFFFLSSYEAKCGHATVDVTQQVVATLPERDRVSWSLSFAYIPLNAVQFWIGVQGNNEQSIGKMFYWYWSCVHHDIAICFCWDWPCVAMQFYLIITQPYPLLFFIWLKMYTFKMLHLFCNHLWVGVATKM